MKAAWIAILATGCTAGGLGDTGPGGSTSLDDDSLSSGVIFKGPMSAGAEVAIQPLGTDAEPIGAPSVGSVDLDDGSYALAVEHGGLVLLSASGTTLEEADGFLSEDEHPMLALGTLDGDSELQVNIITDLTHARTLALMAEGLGFEDAERQANDELVHMIPVGGDYTPEVLGRELSPYGESKDQGWLFAASAVLSNLGLREGDLPVAMSLLREDLADDGELSTNSLEALREAVRSTNPDVAQRALVHLFEDAGLERTIPDLNVALDSDLDGFPNHVDNCRYVPNDDQQDTAGLGFGDACDYRLADISTSRGFGCAALGADGSLSCWSNFAEPAGGAPPRPDGFPSPDLVPWLEDGVSISFAVADIALADHAACLLDSLGAATCWFEGSATLRALPGAYAAVAASEGLGCAERVGGGVDCIDAAGAVVISVADPVRSFALIGDTLCTVDDGSGALSCQDAGGAVSLANQPAGAFASVAGSGSGWGCAITESDGALACFGSGAVSGAPAATGFVEVAVGEDGACAVGADGSPQCWSAGACDLSGAPPAARGLSAAGCKVCGVDPDGLGVCWPQFFAFE